MKQSFLLVTSLAICCTANAQNLDSLFERGKHQEIVAAYTAGGRSFDHNELEIVAAAYDRLGKGDEDEVLSGLVNRFPLVLTYELPGDYHYYGNFIQAGLMERFKTAMIRTYLGSIKDTALGRTILNAFYQDQAIRHKHDDNIYTKKIGLKQKWDNARLTREWARIDSANAILIDQIIGINKGFPSRTTIGSIGTFSLFIMMQHLDTARRDRYDSMLFDAACRKDISMTDYAMYRTMTLVRTHRIPDALFQKSLDSLSAIKCK